MEGMESHPDVELILSAELDHVLVTANPSSLKGLRRQLFQLIRDQVNAEWKVINSSLLLSQVKDSDLGVGDTSTET
jgi:hypothetical protein